MPPMEIRRQELVMMRNKLGYVGMMRFLNQSVLGSGDYTKDHRQFQDGLTVSGIMAQIKERRKQA
jgi:hypothetical protein